jgi:4-amino-4-deoxy-L-arabinose transferase-like glycosyltransferase
VIGPLLSLDRGGLAEPVAAVLFALSVVAWSAAALWFGRRAAILTAFALLLYPGYGGLFHEFASEIVMTTVFSLWALAVTRAAMRPSMARFALAGLGIAWLVLIRPGNAVLVPFALFPLVLAGQRRERLAWAAAFVGAACLPLAAWTLQNGWRYGDYTLARGGNAVVPFYRTFVLDKTVSPTNGPASRRLAAAIQQHLLTRDPYKAYQVTTALVFSSGSSRVHEDLYILSDQVFGWNSAYSTLRDSAWEAIKAHPGTYASSVADTVWQQLSNPVYSTRSPYTPPTPAATGNGGRLPAPSKGELIPAGQTAWISRPDQSIRELWTSPTTHTFVFLKPHQKARFGQITHDLSTLTSNFPHRSGDASLQHRLNQLAYRYPPPIFWLLVGLIALLVRRPRGTKALAMLTSAALTIIAFNALAQSANPRYMLPVVPAFILLAAAALLGHTRPPDPTN